MDDKVATLKEVVLHNLRNTPRRAFLDGHDLAAMATACLGHGGAAKKDVTYQRSYALTRLPDHLKVYITVGQLHCFLFAEAELKWIQAMGNPQFLFNPP